MGTEHFLCVSPSEFASLSVMKFMLESVSSSARQRTDWVLSFNILIWAVTNRPLCSGSDAKVVGDLVLLAVVDFRSHCLLHRRGLDEGLRIFRTRGGVEGNVGGGVEGCVEEGVEEGVGDRLNVRRVVIGRFLTRASSRCRNV